jgi:hypothetical protein
MTLRALPTGTGAPFDPARHDHPALLRAIATCRPTRRLSIHRSGIDPEEHWLLGQEYRCPLGWRRKTGVKRDAHMPTTILSNQKCCSG